MSTPRRKLIYRNKESGGRVSVDEGRSVSASEQFVARVLADHGHRVRLLQERGAAGVKSYDADVDGAPWEFKELQILGTRDPQNSVYLGLRRGKRQNNGRPLTLVYHIHEDQEPNMGSVNRGITLAVLRDTARLIRRVVLVFDDRRTLSLSAEEIHEGESF